MQLSETLVRVAPGELKTGPAEMSLGQGLMALGDSHGMLGPGQHPGSFGPGMRSWDCRQGVGTSGGASGYQGSLLPLGS